ncbi:MAG: phosphatidylglycerol lysyltransferase [Spirochaetaceae bacterium]|jgi:phosphoglucomutase|nr:phosphatidylglycerol lysyltransferase [Spirochaetaceae bacterium]
MILSASGWRDVFAADGDAESRLKEISGFHASAAAAAAELFAGFVRAKKGGGAPRIIVGLDTRPTGVAIAEPVLDALRAKGCRILFCGVTAAPEIMAYARFLGKTGGADGFIYISASHNPIGYNGIKFGLTDGGVLGGTDMTRLGAEFRTLIPPRDSAPQMPLGTKTAFFAKTLKKAVKYKKRALAAYSRFSLETAAGGQGTVLGELKKAIKAAPLGIAADFNGSARAVSIDKDFFKGFGIKFRAINGKAGEIVHQIVPEGEALKPCRDFLEQLRRDDPDFLFAYVPDCDGDRGNIVFFDENAGRVRRLEAQEVFALACLAELCQLVWIGSPHVDENGSLWNTAIAVNDATSMRIDRIARAFGARVFRAETGEANVVMLGRLLRVEGWTVPVMGEGAAGGSIVHPSAVRDPLQTVFALLKLLRIRSQAGKKGFFELWCERSGCKKPYSNDFTLSNIIASLPAFTTTSAYSKYARMQTVSVNQSTIKKRYQKVFAREWEKRKRRLYYKWGISDWESRAYNGSKERRHIKKFEMAGKGGLRIVFKNKSGVDCASIWMRGSGTEPVFRVMADIEGANIALHDELLAWQRGMVLEILS